MPVVLAAPAAGAISAAAIGGAGIGAGAAAGGAAAAGAGAALGAALFNPFTIGLAVVMGGLAVWQGLEQRKQLKRQYAAAKASALNQIGAIDQNILQYRRAYADQSEVASQQARASLAAALNSLGEVSGESLNLYIAQRIADAYLDQVARRTQRDDQVASLQYEKEQIAAVARAGMQSAAASVTPVGFQGIGGVLQGVQMGMTLNANVMAYQQAARVQSAYQSVLPAANAGDPVALAKVQALNSGINPSLINEQAVVAPFMTMNDLSRLHLQTARDTAALAASRLQLLQQQRQQYDGLIRAMRGY